MNLLYLRKTRVMNCLGGVARFAELSQQKYYFSFTLLFCFLHTRTHKD